MEATNFSLKEQVQKFQKNLDNSQLQKQSEICGLNSQLAACKSDLAKLAPLLYTLFLQHLRCYRKRMYKSGGGGLER